MKVVFSNEAAKATIETGICLLNECRRDQVFFLHRMKEYMYATSESAGIGNSQAKGTLGVFLHFER